MSIRILVIAVALFTLVYLADTTKSFKQKSGRTIVTLLLLYLNVLAELRQLSAFSQQLSQYNVDKLYNIAREVVHAFGLSTSSLISLQMFAFSTMAIFALLYNEYSNTLLLPRLEFVEEETKETENQKQNDASKIYVMRRTFICAKMRN